MFEQRKTAIAVWQAISIGIATSMVGMAAHAQTATTEKTVITGSNIKRVDAESSQPVTVISREEIDRSGASTVEELLQTISSANNNGNTVASAASGATTGGISTASLRGLGSQRTLVLINGRRATAYGTITDSVSVDVNSIPLAAIDRIEILRDGASAIYGSDAIAGVVNFILRSDFQGVDATIEYGKAIPRGGAIEKRISGVAGFGNIAKDRFNVMLVGNYAESDALLGRGGTLPGAQVVESVRHGACSLFADDFDEMPDLEDLAASEGLSRRTTSWRILRRPRPKRVAF